MILKKLLDGIEISDRKGDIDENRDIPHIANDSREIGEGDIFVAMKGVLVDGHDYIQKAKDNGAVLAVVDHFTDDDIPQIAVENPRKALAVLACTFYNHPSRII